MEHSSTRIKLSDKAKQAPHLLPVIYQPFQAYEPASILRDVKPEDYHGDKQRISSTAVRQMYASPKGFLHKWLNTVEEDDADHFRIGRAAHMMLLEPDKFRKLNIVMPEFTGLTQDGKVSAQSKEAKNKRDKWISEQAFGALIVSAAEMDMLVGMIEAVLEHDTARGMLSKGVAECSILWVDQDTGVACRARPDFIVTEDNGDVQLVDFKTARSVAPGLFAYAIADHGYHVQMAFYHDAYMAATGKQPQSISFITVEKEAPYEVAVHVMDDDMYAEGQRQYKHALKLYKKCRETNKWPGIQQNAQMISLPSKYLNNPLPDFGFEI